MHKNGFSRRSFLRNVAAGSTGAALVSVPTVAHAVTGEAASEPPWPVTVESYPLLEAGRAASL
jgi:hypothetical protein